MPRYSSFDRAALTAISARQYQVITRSQVLASGMTENALEHRLRAGGPWQRLLPGVFLTATGAAAPEQRDIAALLYAGPGSLLTGTAALRLWGVRAPYTSLIDVLIPDSKQRKSAGFVRIRATARMPTEVFTTGPRRFAPLARAVGDTARDLSKLADVRALSPDAWWKDAGLAGEVDSAEYHLSPEDHERTLARDTRMRKFRINLLHFTPRQIRTRPAEVIAAIRSALAAADFHPPVPIRTLSVAAPPPPRPRRPALARPGTE